MRNFSLRYKYLLVPCCFSCSDYLCCYVYVGAHEKDEPDATEMVALVTRLLCTSNFGCHFERPREFENDGLLKRYATLFPGPHVFYL